MTEYLLSNTSIPMDQLLKSDGSLERMALFRSTDLSIGPLSLGSVASLTSHKDAPVLASADSTKKYLKKVEAELGIALSSFKSEDITKVFASLNTGVLQTEFNPKASVKKQKQKRWRNLELEQLNSSIVKPVKAQAVRPADSAVLDLAKKTTSKSKIQKKITTEPCTTGIEPTEMDVLMGRGSGPSGNKGNRKYLALKDAMQERYLAATKEEKTPISQELLDAVHAWGGRFLNFNKNTKQWYEIDPKRARKKCSQALREVNTPEVRLAKRIKYKEADKKKNQEKKAEESD